MRFGVIGEFAFGGKLGGHEKFSCSCQRRRAFTLGFGGMQVREFYLSLGTSVVGLSEVMTGSSTYEREVKYEA
jgi:hypothetical protein